MQCPHSRCLTCTLAHLGQGEDQQMTRIQSCNLLKTTADHITQMNNSFYILNITLESNKEITLQDRTETIRLLGLPNVTQ
jgi:hypothetical protein